MTGAADVVPVGRADLDGRRRGQRQDRLVALPPDEGVAMYLTVDGELKSDGRTGSHPLVAPDIKPRTSPRWAMTVTASSGRR